MSRIAIVTDSTADLKASAYKRLGVTMVPLKVHFGDEVYLDGVNLTPLGFFSKLRLAEILPRTSQPSPGDFAKAYQQLIDEGHDQIISIHISAGLSGTVQSATIAKSMVHGADIRVIDSKVTSVVLGLILLELASLRDKGASLAELSAAAERMSKDASVFFAVDTLEYLQKNGRIGKAQVLLGSLLNVKPILTLEDGVVASFDKVRGRGKVIRRMMELITGRVPSGTKNVRMAVCHGDCADRADELVAQLEATYGRKLDLYEFVGPVIGCHTGPGLLGVMMIRV